METQVLNTETNRGISPQAQNAATPMFHPSTPQGQPLGRPYRDSAPQPRLPQSGPYQRPVEPQRPQERPQPNFGGKPQRSVDERHDAFRRAQEALHDRHYEDNNLRLQAEIALAEFFLA